MPLYMLAMMLLDYSGKRYDYAQLRFSLYDHQAGLDGVLILAVAASPTLGGWRVNGHLILVTLELA